MFLIFSHQFCRVEFKGEVTTIFTRNVGMAPGSAITGNYIVKEGSTEITSTSASACADDRTTAYLAMKAATCTTIANDFGGKTLPPGVYCDAGAELTVSKDLVLEGAGEYIFQASSSFSTGLNTKITLTGGATADKVFWAVSSSATLGTSSVFQGTLITYASITFETNAQMYGNALAGAAVNFATSNEVTSPFAAKTI